MAHSEMQRPRSCSQLAERDFVPDPKGVSCIDRGPAWFSVVQRGSLRRVAAVRLANTAGASFPMAGSATETFAGKR